MPRLTVISSSHTTSNYTNPSHKVKTAGALEIEDNPFKDLVKNTHDGKVKRASLAGSAATTLLYLFAVAKATKKGNFKVSDMFKINFNSVARAIGLATSALAGGLAGGLIADKKENRKPKLKEAMHQFLGNIVTPISIVGIGTSLIEKHNLSMVKNCIYGGIAAIVGVGCGVTGGNYVASKVNEAIYKENDDRKVGPKDFGIHIDDILTVMAMTNLGDKVKSFVSKALPAIFLICGYEAGTKKAQEEPQKNQNSEIAKR